MMIPTMMTLSIPMTNKCLQAKQMQNHHIINSSFPHILLSVATLPSYHRVITLSPRTQKLHGEHFHRNILKTSLCDMVVQWSKTKYFMKLNP